MLNIPEASKTLTIRFRTDKQKNSLLLNRVRLIRKYNIDMIKDPDKPLRVAVIGAGVTRDKSCKKTIFLRVSVQ